MLAKAMHYFLSSTSLSNEEPRNNISINATHSYLCCAKNLIRTCVWDYHETPSLCLNIKKQSCSGGRNTRAGQTVMILMCCIITVILDLLCLIYLCLCSKAVFAVVLVHCISQKSPVNQTLWDCDSLFRGFDFLWMMLFFSV